MNLDQLNADCREALSDAAPTRAVREIVARAVYDRGRLEQALGTPTEGGIQRLHLSDELTVLNVIWAPRMTLMPHNHNM